MACGYSCGEEMYPGHSKKDRGATGASDRFVDPRTVAITKRAFYCLLKEGGVDTRPLMEYFTTDVPRVSDKDERFVRDAAEKLQQCVILAGKAKPEGSIAFNVQDFHQRKWDIHHGNVYGEFMSIVKTAFEDDVFNFGRFITFFCVSVSFAVYVFDRGMEDAVMSVHAWTDQAIQNNLGRYLVRCGGWEGFCEYADRLMAHLKKDIHVQERRQPQRQDASAALVPLATAGVIGAAVLAAYAMKNVFS